MSVFLLSLVLQCHCELFGAEDGQLEKPKKIVCMAGLDQPYKTNKFAKTPDFFKKN